MAAKVLAGVAGVLAVTVILLAHKNSELAENNRFVRQRLTEATLLMSTPGGADTRHLLRAAYINEAMEFGGWFGPGSHPSGSLAFNASDTELSRLGASASEGEFSTALHEMILARVEPLREDFDNHIGLTHHGKTFRVANGKLVDSDGMGEGNASADE